MEPRKYASKSSIETAETCEMQFFYNYGLKYRSSAGTKTIIGSAVHCVAETLGKIKKDTQDNPTGKVYMEDIGEVEYDEKTWLKNRVLSDVEVDLINKSRINKQTYKDQKTVKLKYGAVRHGEELVQSLIDRAYNHYLSDIDLKNTDKRDYENFVWMLLEQMDPRFENVIDVEYEFDIPLAYDWAILPDGDYMRTKGFVDLITEPVPGTYHIVDYKTGSRSHFPSFETKTYSDIKKDLQLSLYTHALSLMFPHKNIIASLFFIRDGGLFTIGLDVTKNAKRIEADLRQHLEKIKSIEVPKLASPGMLELTQAQIDNMAWNDFKKPGFSNACNFCPARKNKNFGKECDCKFLYKEISTHGLDYVTEKYKYDEKKMD